MNVIHVKYEILKAFDSYCYVRVFVDGDENILKSILMVIYKLYPSISHGEFKTKDIKNKFEHTFFTKGDLGLNCEIYYGTRWQPYIQEIHIDITKPFMEYQVWIK